MSIQKQITNKLWMHHVCSYPGGLVISQPNAITGDCIYREIPSMLKAQNDILDQVSLHASRKNLALLGILSLNETAVLS